MIPAKHRLSHLAETVFESSSSNSGIWDMTIRENIYAQLQLTPLRLPRRPQCCLSFQGWLQGFYCQDLPSIHTLKTKHHRDKWLRLLRIMVFPADRHGMRIITSLTLKASLSPRLWCQKDPPQAVGKTRVPQPRVNGISKCKKSSQGLRVIGTPTSKKTASKSAVPQVQGPL